MSIEDLSNSHLFLHLGKLCFISPQDDANVTFWHWIISVESGATSHCNSWNLISHHNSINFVITLFLNLSNISINTLLLPLFVCGISTPSFGRHCHLLVVNSSCSSFLGDNKISFFFIQLLGWI